MDARTRVRLLVGTEAGLYELGAGERRQFEGQAVTALAADEPRVWALIEGRSIATSAATGEWEAVALLPEAVGTCLGGGADGLLVGTREAHLLRLEEGRRLVRVASFDAVEGRQAWYTPWGEPPDTRSIATGPSGLVPSGLVYVNVHVGGVVRSCDGGRSWRPTLDIDTDVHQVLAHPTKSSLVLAASAVGLGVSDDAGETWRFDTEGLHAQYLRAVAIAGDTVLVSASTGPRGRRAALYRKRLGAVDAFERCRRGLPEWFASNIDSHCLTGSGSIVACGTDEGTVLVSADHGESWQSVAKGLPPIGCVALR